MHTPLLSTHPYVALPTPSRRGYGDMIDEFLHDWSIVTGKPDPYDPVYGGGGWASSQTSCGATAKDLQAGCTCDKTNLLCPQGYMSEQEVKDRTAGCEAAGMGFNPYTQQCEARSQPKGSFSTGTIVTVLGVSALLVAGVIAWNLRDTFASPPSKPSSDGNAHGRYVLRVKRTPPCAIALSCPHHGSLHRTHT